MTTQFVYLKNDTLGLRSLRPYSLVLKGNRSRYRKVYYMFSYLLLGDFYMQMEGEAIVKAQPVFLSPVSKHK